MGVIIPVGYAQVQLVLQANGSTRQQVVTHGCSAAGIEAPDLAASIYTIVTAANRPFVQAQFSSSYQFLGVRVTRMEASGPVLGEFFQTITGSAGFNPMPPNCAVLVRKSTGFGGRQGRGRLYVPPVHVGEDNVGPLGTIAAGIVSTIQTLWTNYRTALDAANVSMVLLHSSPGLTPYEVSGLSVMPTVATQRRRLRR